MNPRLSPSDAESVANLAEIRQINNVTAQVLYDFLNEMPRAITPELMRDANPDGTLSVETVFRAILAELCGLTDRKVMNDYLRPGVKRLNAAEFRANAFYKEIQIPETKF